jgi:hypothetical protein
LSHFVADIAVYVLAIEADISELYLEHYHIEIFFQWHQNSIAIVLPWHQKFDVEDG